MRYLILAALVAGCSSYESIPAGRFEGAVVVEWRKTDWFLFRPDPENPLRFTRANGEVYEPQEFMTNGGSIPRVLRVFKSYSPWGYAKAYVIHDWIFSEHHCGRMEEVDFKASADILAEAVKTMMEDGSVPPPAPAVLTSIDAAVRSGPAKALWDGGTCDDGAMPLDRTAPDLVFRIGE